MKDCGVGEVSESGKGDGISSTQRVRGLWIGTPRAAGVVLPFEWVVGAVGPAGVGGGEVPSLLRSLRVTCGRD